MIDPFLHPPLFQSSCSVPSFFVHTYRFRPVDGIIQEIKTLSDRRFIGFVDDNLFGNPEFAKELFHALEPLKIKWIVETSVNIARDDEMLQLTRDSGCISLLLGFETISPGNLEALGKRVNMVDEYDKVVKIFHSYGIAVH